MAHEKNYHSTKLEFLVLKWAVTEYFKEYLPHHPFLVKINNNPLTYIMITLNLDATHHQWLGALAGFNFQLEYQKWCNTTMADVLSQITTCLDPDTVRSILNGIALGAAHWVEVQNPCCSWGWPWPGARGPSRCQACVGPNAHDWLGRSPGRRSSAEHSFRLVGSPKEDWSEHASSEEGQLILQNSQNFTIHQKALYLCSTPKGENEDLLLFEVLKVHQVATWTDAIGMQDIRAMTILCPYCRNTFGGQEWPIRCGNPSRPVCTA